jgi:copper chaperone CopZ
MTCNRCKANVENIIKSSEGVEEATVDLSSGTVIIKGSSFDLEKIKSGIESIGYKIIKK